MFGDRSDCFLFSVFNDYSPYFPLWSDVCNCLVILLSCLFVCFFVRDDCIYTVKSTLLVKRLLIYRSWYFPDSKMYECSIDWTMSFVVLEVQPNGTNMYIDFKYLRYVRPDVLIRCTSPKHNVGSLWLGSVK